MQERVDFWNSFLTQKCNLCFRSVTNEDLPRCWVLRPGCSVICNEKLLLTCISEVASHELTFCICIWGRYIILGNHRDAWVFGAVDPHSGTASLLEV
jgi:hypothetical protein